MLDAFRKYSEIHKYSVFSSELRKYGSDFTRTNTFIGQLLAAVQMKYILSFISCCLSVPFYDYVKLQCLQRRNRVCYCFAPQIAYGARHLRGFPVARKKRIGAHCSVPYVTSGGCVQMGRVSVCLHSLLLYSCLMSVYLSMLQKPLYQCFRNPSGNPLPLSLPSRLSSNHQGYCIYIYISDPHKAA